MVALKTSNLVKRYGRVTALDQCDFDLYPNEILAVIGDNGAGKSTLIKAICGAVTPDEGEIRLDGKIVHFKTPLEARNAGIETVYQNLALSPALSISDNMFLGREIRKPGFYEALGAKTQKLMAGLKGAADKVGVPFSVDSEGGMFGFFLFPELPQNYAKVMTTDNKTFNTLFHGLLDRGVYIAPALYEAGFMSAAHTDADIAETVAAAGEVFKLLSK